MKQKLCLFLLSSTMLVGCIKETKTVTKETNPYDVPECVRTNTCTGGYTGGTGGGGGGTTRPPFTGTLPQDPHWGELYSGRSKDLLERNNCTPSFHTDSSIYDTRKVKITASGEYSYDPTLSDTRYFTNTSFHLKTLEGVQELLATDVMLKIRFKVKPEPESTGTTNEVCYRRNKGSTSKGYTKLSFDVAIYRIESSGATTEIHTEPFSFVEINSCTRAFDLKPYKEMSPNGIYFVIRNVRSNTKSNDLPSYDKDGFYESYAMERVPGTKCWSMDIEVAADGTKTFD